MRLGKGGGAAAALLRNQPPLGGSLQPIQCKQSPHYKALEVFLSGLFNATVMSHLSPILTP